MGARRQELDDPTRRAAAWASGGVLGVLLVTIGVIASLGATHGPVVGFAAVGERFATAGAMSGMWMLSAWGLGTLARGLWRDAGTRFSLDLGVGIAMLLTVSHLLGVLGGLNQGLAISTLAPGWGVAAWRAIAGLRRAGGRIEPMRTPWMMLVFVVPTAVLMVASASPPGWLWASEFAGYDALSYHLQLIAEWLDAGRIEPATHNVYSFLPGSVEAAGAHAAAMAGAADAREGWPTGLLAGGGWKALIPQWIHAWMTLGAAAVMWDFVRGLGHANSSHLDEADTRRGVVEVAALLAGALVVATPWSVVVGSLAYNEMSVVLLGAAAMAAAMLPGLRPAPRGLLTGVLVGAACGAKPTALFMIGGPVGIALLATVPLRRWVIAVGVGCVAGVVMLLPWMLRNWDASGNPVFPMLAGVFGSGHWTDEQIARYAGAHFASEGVIERLRMLLWPIGDGARGLGHTQWALFAPIALVSGVVYLVAARRASSEDSTGSVRSNQRFALVLIGGLAFQLLAWLSVTHLQSRFLIPVLVPGAALFGLALATTRRRRLAITVGVAAVLVQSAFLLAVFRDAAPVTRPDGAEASAPNEYLVLGTPAFTGELSARSLRELRPRERADLLARLDWPAAANLLAAPGEVVYLLGEARAFFVRPPVVYHTTWDASPLGDAIESAPEAGPNAWTRSLREQGIGMVVVSEPELARLIGKDGWYDPRVTLERVSAWVGSLGEPLWIRADGRVLIFRIGEAP